MAHQPSAETLGNPSRAYVFLGLACLITWALDVPIASSFLAGEEPPGYALGLAGLSAWGPAIAAMIVAEKGQRRGVVRPFLAHPGWVLLALFTPMLLHLPATLLDVALGGSPAQWVYLPSAPEHVAALVMFSIGEEIGWRGYAHPRLVALHGKVAGPLLLGLVWAVWHALMMILPDGRYDLLTTATLLVELPLYSILFGWFLERSGGGLLVAIALHAGAHVDNITHTPEDELRIRVLRSIAVAIAAALAARSLTRGPPARSTEASPAG